MRLFLAQIRPVKGKIKENIATHLDMIDRAVDQRADLILFPELSLTGYEPALAGELAKDKDDPLFAVFQEKSDTFNLVICIGMPIRNPDGITISLLIFQPNKIRTVYSKQLLHSDEPPYFIPGTTQLILEVNGQKIAFGICFEALEISHFLEAKKNGADLYLTSVAKDTLGIEKSFNHFENISKTYRTSICMVNALGPCDNFISAGQSAVWAKDGSLLGKLNAKDSGYLIYEVEKNKVFENYC